MIDAELVATLPKAAVSAAVDLFGVWIPRGGDNARFTIDVPANFGVVMTVSLYHKNRAEVGDGVPYGGSITFTNTTGKVTQEWTGLKEQLRFEFNMVPSVALKNGQVGLAYMRFLQPTWFETVGA